MRVICLNPPRITHGLHAAATPWIAFVSCDSNGTKSSEDDDIFTLARDSGAVAAVRTLLLLLVLIAHSHTATVLRMV